MARVKMRMRLRMEEDSREGEEFHILRITVRTLAMRFMDFALMLVLS